ncbi:diacylglycerol/lipid kinase family protein [Antarctobacter jejuensis]|uniref:diacylglycerol/lipid kinase family protein n=1 Tax=Antarctobacter jejuensis TaxID=1439938 RepID=UPI003FD2D27A
MPDAGSVPMDMYPDTTDHGPVCVIANPRSGRNLRDPAALSSARAVLGARVIPFDRRRPLAEAVAEARAQGARMIVSAGGDGTAMAVAGMLIGTGVPMAVLPMGTFNYFARGLGLSEDPETAACQIIDGRGVSSRVGMVNGQVFLNNASIGIYPSILKQRESIYRRWGRRRLMAHWSVVKTFLRFRKPLQVSLNLDDRQEVLRTALVFVGRSAFQLSRFGIAGGDAVQNGEFAVLVVRAETRRELLHRMVRLAVGALEEGVDYDLYRGDRVSIGLTKRRATLLAYDGEKRRMAGPLDFRMSHQRLRLIVPREAA